MDNKLGLTHTQDSHQRNMHSLDMFIANVAQMSI